MKRAITRCPGERGGCSLMKWGATRDSVSPSCDARGCNVCNVCNVLRCARVGEGGRRWERVGEGQHGVEQQTAHAHGVKVQRRVRWRGGSSRWAVRAAKSPGKG